ncbi:DUF1249 domain-containing protein [Glaciecola petra]|uniref:DUF1249 domain-containing protein n=1 Tax=Glaciecola petra TaxID=3075602 RepID=A0ABU2ZMU3_9ALTE|nr:DUF1249 domain-containing protein [Aestuariibacter sp. P117]MDT0593363.1 DUF1249 domain-containing protein [Aestuariibacter sp. P117]
MQNSRGMKRKYVPHLPSIIATCEHNYVCMLKLLPDCDTLDLTFEFKVADGLKYRIKIIDSSRYTSTLEMSHISKNTPTFLQPKMVVRLYHDAKVAEVLEAQRTARLEPVYEYPNLNMHQRNEKFMVNVFLAEWLHFCLSQELTSDISE